MRAIKRLIIFLLILILLALPVAVALWAGRSLWAGLLVSGGFLCLLLLFFFIRALWLRRREKRFIDGILEQQTETHEDKERQLSGELAKRWKEAVGELKKSQLKQKGNPLYVLPWYMLIGESGSGKTTAIKNSKLSATFTSQPRVSGVSGTKNCDWWFFEQAIIIDTAGRYAIQPDESSDKNEWRVFLSQLSRYRKKEPLNGLVVTLSADSILTSTPQALEEEGRKIRIRIEELMQSLGAKFPVYLLVTKCDLIRGMKEFCDSLPPSALDQAFGYLEQNPEKNQTNFLDRAFDSLKERMRYFRLHIANKPGMGKTRTEALLFPEEFGMLKQGLSSFIQTVFNQNSFQESPLLRGMYFTSGRQSGEPVSHFMSKLKLKLGKNNPPPSDRSYFLHDFFKFILPGDRAIFAPTQRSRDWSRKTRAMGFSSWVLAMVVLCGLLSFSFALTLSTVKQVQKEFSKAPDISGELIRDVNTLEHLRQTIVKIEKQNRSRWLPRFGLNQCDAIERDLKGLYCSSFSKDFLGPYERRMDNDTLDFSEKTPGVFIGAHVSFYAKRINLIDGAREGQGLELLEKNPQPDFTTLVYSKTDHAIPEVLDLLENQYRHYLVWEEDPILFQASKQMKDRLKHLVVDKGISFDWIIDLCNSNGKDIRLSDFWNGSKNLNHEVVIRPAYTVNGFESIHKILTELEQSMGQPLLTERKKRDFLNAYMTAYLDSWNRFSMKFPEGALTLSGKEEHLSAAIKMSGKDGPYFTFLDKMAEEIIPCFSDENLEIPQWALLVQEFSDIREYEETAKKGKDTGVMGLVKKKGLRMMGRVGRIAAASSSSPEKLMVSSEVFKKYREALEAISKACTSAPASFKLASQVFNEDTANGESCVAAANRAADELKVSMANYKDSQKTFARLLEGPINYMWSHVTKRAACQLQTLWDESVLSEIQGVYDNKVLSEMLLGKDGYVNTFSNGPGAPFIGRTRKKGYYAKKALGESIPFKSDFLTFLTRGSFSAKSAQNLYKVKMDGIPTDTNPDASLIPHVTKLELECAAGVQSLENYNYPVSHTFEWSPTECGDVNLKILIGNLALKKSYTGFRPFARFVKDFADGQHTFYRSDFPDKGPDLKRMGIKFIKVKYKISGGGPVIRLLSMAAGRAPEEIVSCSD
ncbi:MAG: hypothetical protein KKD44_07245 [Proteobacteria bacterium]|nr:hypothetical protein [Pseudomonadota bacterium]